jgi:hypothetical protein
MTDPDYSPAYQDEYQRLWHKAAAERDAYRKILESMTIPVGMAAYEIARKVEPTGLQVLTTDGTRWWVTIKNRTYQSTVEISKEKAEVWKRLLA